MAAADQGGDTKAFRLTNLANCSNPTSTAIFSAGGGLRITNISYAKSNPNIVYALHAGPEDEAIIRRSDNGGQSFQTITPGYPAGGQIGPNNHNNLIWVSPTDPNFIIAGGVHLYRSTDGGSSFVQISDGYVFDMGNEPHVDQHFAVADPGFNGTTNKKVYICNDGGVYRTDDISDAAIGSRWVKSTNGYSTGQYLGAAGRFAGGTLVGGMQDNASSQSSISNTEANRLWFGDGGFAAIDPGDPSYVYVESQNLVLARIRNGTPDYVFNGAPANFVAPFILDPNDPNRLLAGGNKLWRSNNIKAALPTFTPVAIPTTVRPQEAPISAIAVAPGNPNIVWFADEAPGNTRVFKTTNALDASPAWSRVDDGSSPIPNRFITRILIDPGDSSVVYVTLGGMSQPDNIYRTTTGGADWTDITGEGFPNVPVRGIARHPYDSDRLFVGTEIGLYETQNGGDNWLVAIEGPYNTPVYEVTFMPGSTTLLAATYGRGLWTAVAEPVTAPKRTRADFDGDGRSDISVFRPSTTTWHLNRSTFGVTQYQFGLATDIITPEDFDADRKADFSVFRPSNAIWYRVNSSDGTFTSVQYGLNGDIPMPADFDGDEVVDQAVFRPSTGYWHLNLSRDQTSVSYQWGQNGDTPVTGDFDGDGDDDFAVFRFSEGVWYLYDSANWVYYQWGLAGDIPVAADFDGDQLADIAVWRPSNGFWYILESVNGYEPKYLQWGLPNDVPVPADYDGDGRFDIAVWRPSDGNWYLLQTTNGAFQYHFGANGDIPIPKK